MNKKSKWQQHYDAQKERLVQKTSLNAENIKVHIDRNLLMTHLNDNGKYVVIGRQCLNEHDLKEGKEIGRASKDVDVIVANPDFAVQHWDTLTKNSKQLMGQEMCKHEEHTLNSNPHSQVVFSLNYNRSLSGAPGFEAYVAARDKASGEVIIQHTDRVKLEISYKEKLYVPTEQIPITDPSNGETKNVTCHTRESVIATKFIATSVNKNPDKNPRINDGYDIAESDGLIDKQKMAEVQKLAFQENNKEMPAEPPKMPSQWQENALPNNRFSINDISERFERVSNAAWGRAQLDADRAATPEGESSTQQLFEKCITEQASNQTQTQTSIDKGTTGSDFEIDHGGKF